MSFEYYKEAVIIINDLANQKIRTLSEELRNLHKEAEIIKEIKDPDIINSMKEQVELTSKQIKFWENKRAEMERYLSR